MSERNIQFPIPPKAKEEHFKNINEMYLSNKCITLTIIDIDLDVGLYGI